MGQFASFMISTSHRRLRRVLAWLLAFALMLSAAAWIASEQVAQNIRVEIGRSLETYGGLRTSIVAIFDAMDAQLVGTSCSPEFTAIMRRIAFLPDGISELMYAPGGTIACAANMGQLETPIDLGPPDIAPSEQFGIALWINRQLDMIGLGDLRGSIAGRGDFALAIPPQFLPAHTGPDWMEQELLYHVGGGGWMHRAGVDGISIEAELSPRSAPLALLTGAIYQSACDSAGEHCVAARVWTWPLMQQRIPAIVIVLLTLAVLAAWFAQQICSLFERHWSFEARFLRNFRQESVVCAYQPLLNLHNDKVTGCEVLARWLDVDGTIVMPDQFLPIVEKHNLTERFTAKIIACAYKELSERLPPTARLQLNFNIFPRDLNAERLIPLFARFLETGSRFVPVIELVETAEVDPETAQVEIEKLRAVGIGVYVDDFGAGYSSMQNLACLTVDGVKLDRSFAMASDDSVMGRMLDHAIELIHAAGRILVVEGVETHDRLEKLKASGRVDFAQGYGIARPLTIDSFVAFMGEQGPRPNGKPRLVA